VGGAAPVWVATVRPGVRKFPKVSAKKPKNPYSDVRGK
jgi:hypothetical protein